MLLCGYVDVIVRLRCVSQEVPDALVAMAERYEAWRERREAQREREGRQGRPGGGRGGGRGGRRDKNMASFI